MPTPALVFILPQNAQNLAEIRLTIVAFLRQSARSAGDYFSRSAASKRSYRSAGE